MRVEEIPDASTRIARSLRQRVGQCALKISFTRSARRSNSRFTKTKRERGKVGENAFEGQQSAVRRSKPESGFALCGIDDFEFPPNNLFRLNRFDTLDEALAAMDRMTDKNPEGKFCILGPDGTTYD